MSLAEVLAQSQVAHQKEMRMTRMMRLRVRKRTRRRWMKLRMEYKELRMIATDDYFSAFRDLHRRVGMQREDDQ